MLPGDWTNRPAQALPGLTRKSVQGAAEFRDALDPNFKSGRHSDFACLGSADFSEIGGPLQGTRKMASSRNEKSLPSDRVLVGSSTYVDHPLAAVFPMMETKDREELVQDILRHGLREPILLFEGKILDGRNRYRACQEAGVEPSFEMYEGNDPLAYIVSANLRRRHLDTGQRAMVAARLATLRGRTISMTPRVPEFGHPPSAKLPPCSTSAETVFNGPGLYSTRATWIYVPSNSAGCRLPTRRKSPSKTRTYKFAS